MSAPKCRLCGSDLTQTFVDLGMSPPCEDFLTGASSLEPETFYPLDVRICDRCLLVQLPAYLPAEEHLRGVRLLLVLQRQLGRPRRSPRR